jgi:hypothetical protein
MAVVVEGDDEYGSGTNGERHNDEQQGEQGGAGREWSVGRGHNLKIRMSEKKVRERSCEIRARKGE